MVSVPAGRITALVGGNGAGKTTAMRMLAGLLTPDSGTIRYKGEAVEGWSSAQRVAAGIVLVPEGRLVFPDMTVEENLRLGAINRQARPHTAEGLDKVYAQFPRLGERRRQAAGTLSGGEQQMLALGRGLMSLPKVLLLDEPSLGLAPLMVDLIFDAIGALAGAGMTILLSEQNVGLALELAERAFVLGKRCDRAHRLRRRPARQCRGPARLSRPLIRPCAGGSRKCRRKASLHSKRSPASTKYRHRACPSLTDSRKAATAARRSCGAPAEAPAGGRLP